MYALHFSWHGESPNYIFSYQISGLSMTLSAFTGGDGVSGVAGPLRCQIRRDVKLPWSPCQSSEDLDSTIGWKSCRSLHS